MLEIKFSLDEYLRVRKQVTIENEKTVEPILRDFFVNDLSRKEVAEKHSVSRSYVSRQINQFITQIAGLKLDGIQVTLAAGDSKITLTGKTDRNEDGKT